MKNRRFLLLLSFLTNMLIFIMVVCAVTMSFRAHRDGAFGSTGAQIFRYFTTDSNVLAGLVSFVGGLFGLIALLKGRDRLPEAAVILKYVGASAVLMTFSVVIVFLGPVYGFAGMYAGANLYMHGVVPILCVVSFVAFDRGRTLRKRDILFAVLPVVVYGIVYFIEVVIIGKNNGGWPDLYGFVRSGYWLPSVILCLSGGTVLAVILRLLHNACDRNQRGEGYESKDFS